MWTYLNTAGISGYFGGAQPASAPAPQVQYTTRVSAPSQATNPVPQAVRAPQAAAAPAQSEFGFSNPLALIGRSSSVDSWSTQGQWVVDQISNLTRAFPQGDQLSGSVPNVLPQAGTQPKSIRTSLGQRGGAIRKADGYELWYGMVGDQPSAPSPAAKTSAGISTSSVSSSAQQPRVRQIGGSETVPMPPRVTAAPPQSIRTSLGHRGGLVRQTNSSEVQKADGYDVFYGIVGSSATPGQSTPGFARPSTETPTVRKSTTAAVVEENQKTITENKEETPAREEPAKADAGAEEAADPAVDTSTTSDINEEWFRSDEGEQISNELRARLGNLQGYGAGELPKSVQQFSLATPACSFAPANGKMLGPAGSDVSLPHEGFAPTQFSIATPAASFAPSMAGY